MGTTRGKHRPLLSGVRIISGTYGLLALSLIVLAACGEPESIDPRYVCWTKEDHMAEQTPTPVPYDHVERVRDKYVPLFEGYPNYSSAGYGNITEEDPPRELGPGIVVSVTEMVDPDSVPEAQRIPSCIEGVPVWIRTPVEFQRMPETADDGETNGEDDYGGEDYYGDD